MRSPFKIQIRNECFQQHIYVGPESIKKICLKEPFFQINISFKQKVSSKFEFAT